MRRYDKAIGNLQSDLRDRIETYEPVVEIEVQERLKLSKHGLDHEPRTVRRTISDLLLISLHLFAHNIFRLPMTVPGVQTKYRLHFATEADSRFRRPLAPKASRSSPQQTLELGHARGRNVDQNEAVTPESKQKLSLVV